MLDQKAVFAERLKRINSGRQFEHADVVGKATQKAYNRKFGEALKQKKKRKPFDRFMVPLAFLLGMSSITAGRLLYFQMTKWNGLPDAFYDLGSRGMILFAIVLAGLMTVIFHLSTRSRLQALLVGCVVMHYGEAAVASNAPELWSNLFSPDYAAALAEEGRDYRLITSG
jgi:hypothetical protein